MTAFKLRKDAKDGLRGQCASCEATRRSNYKANNKAIISVKGKEYYRVNKNRILNSVKTYYRENAKDKRAYGRSYHAANAANIAIKDKEHYEANKERILAATTAGRLKRRKRVPKWYTHEKETIANMYRKAHALRKSGKNVHVDHILPLRGKLVSGLHTLANLQIIDATANLHKSNHFAP